MFSNPVRRGGLRYYRGHKFTVETDMNNMHNVSTINRSIDCGGPIDAIDFIWNDKKMDEWIDGWDKDA